jgi:hypothetical protein
LGQKPSEEDLEKDIIYLRNKFLTDPNVVLTDCKPNLLYSKGLSDDDII